MEDSTAAASGMNAGTAVSTGKAPARDWAHLARVSIVVLGGALIALVSATPNAFNTISGQFAADTGTSSAYVALLLGLGVAGLQFTLPAGILLDRMGPAVTCLAGLVAVVGGYIAMSFTENHVLLLLEYAVASLGSGTTFLSALSTAIGMGYPIGVALVSLTMSLSISFTVALDKVYGDKADCTYQPHCWRNYVRVYAIVCGGVFAVGALTLVARPTKPKPRAPSADDAEARVSTLVTDEEAGEAGTGRGGKAGDSPRSIDRPLMMVSANGGTRSKSLERPMTLWQSMRIFRRPYFVAIFFANTIGLGSGILVITTALQMWEQYNTDHTKNHWNELITVYFSVFSGGFNIISPLLSDFLHKRGYMRRSMYLVTCLTVIGLDFVVLGIMTLVPHQHHGACHLKMAFVFMMALVGGGFGTFLTVLPTLLEDIYGMANFGRFMSYMQLGSTAFAVAVPTITSGINSAFHSYNSLYWGIGTLLLGSAGGVWACVRLETSPTFAAAASRDVTAVFRNGAKKRGAGETDPILGGGLGDSGDPMHASDGQMSL